MSPPTILTAADCISYPDNPHHFISVPNDRIGTSLRQGEDIFKVETDKPLSPAEPSPFAGIMACGSVDKNGNYSPSQELLMGRLNKYQFSEVIRPEESKYIIAKDIIESMKMAAEDPKPKALTHDTDKPPLATLPWKALREVAMAQAYGAHKYSPNNWRKGLEVTRNASCAIRHIADYLDGRDLDDESKRHALAHAACRVLFMLENILENTAIDDRFKK